MEFVFSPGSSDCGFRRQCRWGDASDIDPTYTLYVHRRDSLNRRRSYVMTNELEYWVRGIACNATLTVRDEDESLTQ